MSVSIFDIANIFALKGHVSQIQRWEVGHINETFVVQTGLNGRVTRYVMQRINHHVFQDPSALMENIVKVTTYLRKRIQEHGGDPDRETLTLVPTRDGRLFHPCKTGDFWRTYRFIEGTRTYQQVVNLEHLYEAARAIGRFLRLLDAFPAEELHITIPDFHHTPKRFHAFIQALDADQHNRAYEARDVIQFALERADIADTIIAPLTNGELPQRVTHNDTKLNNVLIDEATGKGICVVDLDTVMPGSSLFDFGDFVRSAANTGEEDDIHLDRVGLDLDRFRTITKGYLQETADTLTQQERALLHESPRILTYELGLRFLTDYLNGDVYFRIHRPRHNLDRARAQFKLVEDIEQKTGEMNRIVGSA